MLLDEGDWQLIYTGSGTNGTLVTVPLLYPCDFALIAVTLTPLKPEWRKAGWIEQSWNDGIDNWVIKAENLSLNGKLIELIPVSSALLTFNPVSWLKSWNIKIKVRGIE